MPINFRMFLEQIDYRNREREYQFKIIEDDPDLGYYENMNRFDKHTPMLKPFLYTSKLLMKLMQELCSNKSFNIKSSKISSDPITNDVQVITFEAESYGSAQVNSNGQITIDGDVSFWKSLIIEGTNTAWQ